MKFKIARAGVHMWEEPPISGSKGSGTIFFSGCVLKCVYCQNYEISHENKGIYVSEDQLIKLMLYLQGKGVHNINLVNPTHYAAPLSKVLKKIKGNELTIPVVYNTGGYDSIDNLKRLEGLIDIYLPDIKYFNDKAAEKYSGKGDYFVTASNAVKEMRRQQPQDIFTGDIMKKGVIVRHLILPGQSEDSKKVLDYLFSLDNNIYVSLMSQYFPTPATEKIKELNRRITKREYGDVLKYFDNLGLINGFSQELDSAVQDYVPSFDLKELEITLNLM